MSDTLEVEVTVEVRVRRNGRRVGHIGRAGRVVPINDWEGKFVPRPGDRNAVAEEVLNKNDVKALVATTYRGPLHDTTVCEDDQ